MTAPNYTAADFTQGLLNLYPTGRAWPREADAVFPQVVAAQAPSYARLHARANYLLTDAFPSTAVELLPEWEASLGLPDPCAGEDQTIAQRQAHVVARLTQSNGPTIAALTAFAAALGYTITIQEFAPCRADEASADDQCNEPGWAFVWQVTYPGITIQYALADAAFADDQVETTGNSVLECELNRLKPAHTILLFNYSGALAVGGFDEAPGFDTSGFA